MYFIDNRPILIDNCSQVLACADSCPPCAWAILNLIFGCCCQYISCLFFWRSCWILATGVSLVCGKSAGMVRVGCTRQLSKKYCLAEEEFLVWGQYAIQPVRCELYIIQMEGIRMWGKACNQLRMHTRLFPWTEGPVRGSNYVGEQVHSVLPVGVLAWATPRSILVPI